MSEDLLNRANLGLLPDERGRFGSFGASLAVNLAIAGFVVLLSVAGVHEVKHRVNTAILIFPAQPKPYVPPPPPRIIHNLPPPPKVEAPKIVMPKPRAVVEPPKPVEMKLPEQAPRMEPAPPRRVVPPPQPKVGLFTSSHPTLVANNMKRPSVKTGGFGDPQGVHTNPNATRPATIAAVGSFSGTPGIGSPGAGAARRGSVHGVNFGSGVANGVPGGRDRGTVASAGFSNGVVGGTGRPGSRGRVAQGGFGGPSYAQGAAPVRKQEVAHTTPLVLLSKPKPGYTDEARRLKIEGDVTLEVRFTANGQVEVLRVVSGLGYGLNELAEQAARHITFKPATRDGRAIDEVTLIHVTFQLA